MNYTLLYRSSRPIQLRREKYHCFLPGSQHVQEVRSGDPASRLASSGPELAPDREPREGGLMIPVIHAATRSSSAPMAIFIEIRAGYVIKMAGVPVLADHHTKPVEKCNLSGLSKPVQAGNGDPCLRWCPA